MQKLIKKAIVAVVFVFGLQASEGQNTIYCKDGMCEGHPSNTAVLFPGSVVNGSQVLKVPCKGYCGDSTLFLKDDQGQFIATDMTRNQLKEKRKKESELNTKVGFTVGNVTGLTIGITGTLGALWLWKKIQG